MLNQNYVFMQKDSKDKFETLSGQQRENTEQVMMQVKDLKKHFKGVTKTDTTYQGAATSGSPVHSQSPRNRRLSQPDAPDTGLSLL